MKKNILAVLNFIDLYNCEKIIRHNFALYKENAFYSEYPNSKLNIWLKQQITERKETIKKFYGNYNINNSEYSYLFLIIKDVEFNNENNLDQNSFTIKNNINNFINYLNIIRADDRTSVITNTWLNQEQANVAFVKDALYNSVLSEGLATIVQQKTFTKFKEFPKFKKEEFENLQNVFDLYNKNKISSLERRMQKAINWIGKSFYVDTLEDKFLICATGLEFLLLKDGEDTGIKNKFANRTSYLLSEYLQYLNNNNLNSELFFVMERLSSILPSKKVFDNIELKDIFYEDAKKFYEIRCDIVHNGRFIITEKEYSRFVFYIRCIIIYLTQLSIDNSCQTIDAIIKMIKNNSE